MPYVDLDEKPKFKVLAHGTTGTGKTRWAASWPKPFFLSASIERGWATFRALPPEHYYTPGEKPKVWKVAGSPDFMQGLAEAKKLMAKGEVQTVVVDSWTWYGESFLKQVDALTKDGRQAYMSLQSHIINMMQEMNELPCHVIWLCTSQDEDVGRAEALTKGAISMPGRKLHNKLPQLAEHVLYFRSFRKTGKDRLQWEIRTRSYDTFPARVRDVDEDFPDPLPHTTFRDYEKLVIEHSTIV